MSCNDEADRLGEGDQVSERCAWKKQEIKLSCLLFPAWSSIFRVAAQWQHKQTGQLNQYSNNFKHSEQNCFNTQSRDRWSIISQTQTTYDTSTQVFCLTTCHVAHILIECGKDGITSSFTKWNKVFFFPLCNNLQHNISITWKNKTSVPHLRLCTQAWCFPPGSVTLL